jgi:DNA-binding response OmpR family regulator
MTSFNRKVLLVEDDPSICEAINEVLQLEEIEVRTATNGKAGIEELRAGYHPDLILLDLMMPGTDGMWFCAEREKEPELMRIPVVIMSAHGQVETRTAGLSVNAVLKKPIGLDDLLQTVKPFLASKSA